MEELSDDEQQRQLPAIREALFALNDAKRRAVEFSNNLAKIDAALEFVLDPMYYLSTNANVKKTSTRWLFSAPQLISQHICHTNC